MLSSLHCHLSVGHLPTLLGFLVIHPCHHCPLVVEELTQHMEHRDSAVRPLLCGGMCFEAVLEVQLVEDSA